MGYEQPQDHQQYPVVAPYQPYGEPQQQIYPQSVPQPFPQPNFSSEQQHVAFQQPMYVQTPEFSNGVYPQAHALPVYPQPTFNPVAQAEPMPARQRMTVREWFASSRPISFGITLTLSSVFLYLALPFAAPWFLFVWAFVAVLLGTKTIQESGYIQERSPKLYNKGLLFVVCGTLLLTFCPPWLAVPLLTLGSVKLMVDVYIMYFEHSNRILRRLHISTIVLVTINTAILFLFVCLHAGRRAYVFKLIFMVALMIQTVIMHTKLRKAYKEESQTELRTVEVAQQSAQESNDEIQLAAQQQELFNNIQQAAEQQRLSQQPHLVQQQ